MAPKITLKLKSVFLLEVNSGIILLLYNSPNLHFHLFILQVKQLLDMLVRKCGLDAVKVVMPEEHMKLLTNIRKVSCKLSARLN